MSDSQNIGDLKHPFLDHLSNLLAFFELGKSSSPIPRYDGPTNQQTESILRSIESLGQRVLTAEEESAAIKAAEVSERDTKKRRTVGDTSSASSDTNLPSTGESTSRGETTTSEPTPATSSSHVDHIACPSCGNTIGVPTSAALASVPSEPELSAVEELQRLKIQVRDIARACLSIHRGQIDERVKVPVQDPDMVALKEVVNALMDRAHFFWREFARVAIEVGTEGKLGGQAYCVNVEGAWREVTNVFNNTVGSLTAHARVINVVANAVASGDLSQEVDVYARGELVGMNAAINTVVVQSRLLSEELLRVMTDIGCRGILGGQIYIPNAEGVWKDLVTTANRALSSLTDEVRAIQEVIKAILHGDLTKKIDIEVEGEFLDLKQSINEMVDKLRGYSQESAPVISL